MLSSYRQSPIDISPGELLYDPGLQEFSLTPNKVQGRVINTGHTVTFQVLSLILGLHFLQYSAQVDAEDSHLVNVTGGSLGYNYQVTTVVLHWGEGEEGGSEHSVGGRHAALEVQVTRNIFFGASFPGQSYFARFLATTASCTATTASPPSRPTGLWVSQYSQRLVFIYSRYTFIQNLHIVL